MTDTKADFPVSVIFREGPPTVTDYLEAAEDMIAAAKDLTDKAASRAIWGCYICHDTGHTAESCHHNPLLAARDWTKATKVYVCWHCGFVATNDTEAREHFGKSDEEPAACLSDTESSK